MSHNLFLSRFIKHSIYDGLNDIFCGYLQTIMVCLTYGRLCDAGFSVKIMKSTEKCRIDHSQLQRFMLLSDINNESISHTGEMQK